MIGWVRDKTGRQPVAVAAARRRTAAEPAAPSRSRRAGGRGARSGRPDEVTEAVVSIVAEKTGYPPDMLDLDLDLEADLGVDTVKQAEVFAAVRERFGIARDDDAASCATSRPWRT